MPIGAVLFLLEVILIEEVLVKEAKELGINASLYNLLPPKKRDAALRADIAREKRRRKEEVNGKA